MRVYQTYGPSDYDEGRPGIMGRRAKWSEEKYADWYIVEVEVLTEFQE